MKITINNKDIKLKYSFRSMMIYEKITGGSFQPKGITEVMIYFYSTILASDKNIALTFDEFVEWCDNNPTIFNDFSIWLTSIFTKNSAISDTPTESNNEDGSFKKN